ncbi:MAG: class I SAM-dependent methyltransferase, partial [Nitrospirae bacterium]
AAVSAPLRFQPVARELIARVAAPLDREQRDESAVPSYLHPNPLVRWMITRRLEVAAELAGEALAAAGPEPEGLDFGCGVGLLAPTLAPHLARLHLTDLDTRPAAALVEALGLAGCRIWPAEAWAEALPDGSLALVVAADVLEHVEPLEPVVARLAAKLAPGGSLILSGPTESWVYGLARRIAGFSGHYHVRNVFHIERVVEAAGLRLVRRVALPFPGLPKLFRVSRYQRPA